MSTVTFLRWWLVMRLLRQVFRVAPVGVDRDDLAASVCAWGDRYEARGLMGGDPPCSVANKLRALTMTVSWRDQSVRLGVLKCFGGATAGLVLLALTGWLR